jgi:hypothetical protein
MYTIPEITLWKAGECWKGTAVHIVPVFGLRGPVTEDGLRHHESNLEGNQLVELDGIMWASGGTSRSHVHSRRS